MTHTIFGSRKYVFLVVHVRTVIGLVHYFISAFEEFLMRIPSFILCRFVLFWFGLVKDVIMLVAIFAIAKLVVLLYRYNVIGCHHFRFLPIEKWRCLSLKRIHTLVIIPIAWVIIWNGFHLFSQTLCIFLLTYSILISWFI